MTPAPGSLQDNAAATTSRSVASHRSAALAPSADPGSATEVPATEVPATEVPATEDWVEEDSATEDWVEEDSAGAESFAETGWHEDWVAQPDGTVKVVWTPLTEAEFLHPREGDHLPNSTFHDRSIATIKALLERWFSHQPDTRIFSDLLFKWDSAMGDHCPDIAVVFGLRHPERDRSNFVVAKEGVRPALVMEVVSPRYRKCDRQDKVRHYAQVQVPEYIILDRRKSRKQTIEEVIGYRLAAPGIYQPIPPDEHGRILSQVAGLWISLRDGNVVLESAETGERLLTDLELAQQADADRQRANVADQRANAADQRASAADQRAKQLADFLRSQGFDPDQI
jgi:Uma2 family endonuclease